MISRDALRRGKNKILLLKNWQRLNDRDRSYNLQVVLHLLLIDAEFIKTMFVMATPIVLLFHTATPAAVIAVAIETDTHFVTHAEMHFHGDSRRNAEINDTKQAEYPLFHDVKVIKIRCRSSLKS